MYDPENGGVATLFSMFNMNNKIEHENIINKLHQSFFDGYMLWCIKCICTNYNERN